MKLRENYMTVRSGRIPFLVSCDFRKVLAALTVLSDKTLLPDRLVDAALMILVFPRTAVRLISFQKRSVLLAEILRRFTYFHGGGKKMIDFTDDYGYIYASFLQCYGLDLSSRRVRLSWKRFCYLLLSLPPDAKIPQIITVRTRKIPIPNNGNADEIAALRRAKRFFALEHSECNLQDGLAGLFHTFSRQE